MLTCLVMMQVNQKVILQSISWDLYEQLLKEYKDSNALHFAYDDGFLEVEVPLAKDERANRILQDLVAIICVEKKLRVGNFGSTTFRKALKTKGCEPDTTFYLQNLDKVRGFDDIDLSKDPPPDLVIEVDITSPSLNKMPIYTALGVLEIWLYKGKNVEFYKLYGEFYQQISNSLTLPMLNSRSLTIQNICPFSDDSITWLPK